jgi:hypothetical protein
MHAGNAAAALAELGHLGNLDHWRAARSSGCHLATISLQLYDVYHSTCSVEGDVLSIGIIGLCLLTSCIASVATFAKASARITTLAVQRRNFKRAIWYPCISVLSYAPIMVAYTFPDLFYKPFFAVAIFCEAANGAMNAGMYGLQSHYASRLAKSPNNKSIVVVETDAHAASTNRSSLQTSDAQADDVETLASCHVHFGGVDVVSVNLSTSSFEKFADDLPDWVENRRLAPRLCSSF